MYFLLAGGAGLAALSYFVLIPNYLEVSRTLGLDKRDLSGLGVFKWLWERSRGFRSDIANAIGLFLLAAPDIVNSLKIFDFTPLMSVDNARWLTAALGLASIALASYGRLFAARAEPRKEG